MHKVRITSKIMKLPYILHIFLHLECTMIHLFSKLSRARDVSTPTLATRYTEMNETRALILRSFDILLYYDQTVSYYANLPLFSL